MSSPRRKKRKAERIFAKRLKRGEGFVPEHLYFKYIAKPSAVIGRLEGLSIIESNNESV